MKKTFRFTIIDLTTKKSKKEMGGGCCSAET
jgi:hypothetical protein